MHRRRIRSLATAGIMIAAALGGAPAAAPAAQQVVPCKVFGPGITCGNPIVQGAVDGQWIALILHYWGSSDGADRADVVSIGLGGNGGETKTLPRIQP